MNTVTIGTKNSYSDWGIILRPKSRPKPTPKYNYVSIPGRSGDQDLTEALGEVQYENLTFPIEFNVIDAMNTWDSKLSIITNYLHGKKFKVTFSDDSNYYYYGRIKVNNLSSDRSLGILTLECNFNPYKYKQNVTSVSKSVSAGNSYDFTNDRMSVVPTLTLSSAMTITFEGSSYSLSSGSQKVLDIQFKDGTNTIGVTTGSGTITASYQEGSL